jgi:tRNA (cytidine/uridine-2'-O-)-methyltransferase
VRPLGFDLDEKAVRRAGIDHWRKVDLQVHEDVEAFLVWAAGRRAFAFTRHAERCLSQATFQAGDVLVFGRESTGLPEGLVRALTCFRIPVPGPIRSLNLANAVAVAAYRALEAISPELFPR